MNKTYLWAPLGLALLAPPVSFAHEDEALTLSPEAFRRFGMQTKELKGAGPWAIPATAVLRTGESTYLYRLRHGAYARIAFTATAAAAGPLLVASAELRSGDSVVTQGVGYLRTAELNEQAGEPAGHSH